MPFLALSKSISKYGVLVVIVKILIPNKRTVTTFVIVCLSFVLLLLILLCIICHSTIGEFIIRHYPRRLEYLTFSFDTPCYYIENSEYEKNQSKYFMKYRLEFMYSYFDYSPSMGWSVVAVYRKVLI